MSRDILNGKILRQVNDCGDTGNGGDESGNDIFPDAGVEFL